MSAPTDNSDDAWMRRAITLARRGWYTTPPNPRVGCVLVYDGRLVGEGWHERASRPHAEANALADVAANGFSAAGASVYVTLEPCSTHGHTPPCCDALIEAGVARVVVGCVDPNPAVHGAGIARLREAGIEVVTGVAETACRALNPGFEKRMTTGRPRVTVKLAMSLDGRTAAADGSSRWITGEAARADTHRLRAAAGAVLVGRGTQQADDPELSVRLPGEWRQPRPVVLDTHLAITPDARLFATDRAPWLFTANADPARVNALEDAGARVDIVNANEHGLDIGEVLGRLGQSGEINDVLVEAGARLAGAFVAGGWVDSIVVYMAPTLLGDAGRGLLSLPGVNTLEAAQSLVIEHIEPVGCDWRITARPSARHNQDR